jgi:tRNA pseudouridine-54 N-methylase
MYDESNRGTVDVKWRVLEFSLLLSSALKFDSRIEFLLRGMPQMKYHLADFFSLKSKDFSKRQN